MKKKVFDRLVERELKKFKNYVISCLLYTSPSPRDS